MNLEHRVVVTSHRPWLRWGMIALITMLLLAAALRVRQLHILARPRICQCLDGLLRIHAAWS